MLVPSRFFHLTETRKPPVMHGGAGSEGSTLGVTMVKNLENPLLEFSEWAWPTVFSWFSFLTSEEM